MRFLKKSLLALAISATAADAQNNASGNALRGPVAANKQVDLGGVYVLPWQWLVTSQFSLQEKLVLKAALAQTVSNGGTNPKTLGESEIKGFKWTIKQRQFAASVYHIPRLEGLGTLAIMPRICHIGRLRLIVLEAIELQSGRYFSYRVLAQRRDLPLETTSEILGKAWTELLAERRGQVTAGALQKIRINSKVHISRKDVAESECLTAVLTDNLRNEGFQVIPSHLGADYRALKSLLNMKSIPIKHNRVLSNHWRQAPGVLAADGDGRVTFETNFSLVEGIYGRKIGKDILFPVTIKAGVEGTLNLTLPDQLKSVLAEDEKSLQVAEFPVVAKVQRAWAYLDRGRAWGLSMNDRLSANNGDVKGHVVGFFGADANLKSPRGFPVSEGAIVYIRKGQHLVKPGLLFEFDKTTFPTAFPPSANKK